MTTLIEPQASIWKNRPFVILFSSAFFVALSGQIYNLALPLLVYDLTQSSQVMGVIRGVEFLPNLLLALFLGVWVDRIDKKRWSQTMLIGQVMVVLCSYTAVEMMSNPLWVLFPCAFLMMAFNYGYHLARITMLKNALPPEAQNTATARMSVLNSVMETVGPILSGALLLLSAVHSVFLGVALMLLVAYWQLNQLTLNPTQVPPKTNTLSALKQGWCAFVADRNMVLITLAVMVINTTGAVFWIQAIYYAKAELELNSVEVSYLVAASGLGGLIGAFSADKVRKKIGLGWLLIASIALESLGFVIPMIAPNVWTLAAAFLWVSAVGLYSSICIWSYRQEAFCEQYLGRVAGITGSLFKLLMPFGLAASGYLVAAWGSQFVFLLCFALQIFASACLILSRVRHLE
ncbi:MFS transporter [Vibrio sp. 10N]|uniref:MFS transporter n=1 Tax=Vibrio sp. 10N TaxID=3058938 RepID=UPI0028131AF6|nr:MFS transporter [Vibrio sp. 10N]